VNLPNKLTILRILMTFLFIFLIRQEGLMFAVSATIIFALASLTDYFDGYIAKKYNLISDFGKLMDPIADKFLMLAAFLAFVRLHLVDDWMVILIFSREIIVTGLRIFALTKNKVLAAERGGKRKTVSQIVAIFVILGFIIFKRSTVAIGGWTEDVEFWWKIGISISMLITVCLTVTSGLSYLWRNRELIKINEK